MITLSYLEKILLFLGSYPDPSLASGNETVTDQCQFSDQTLKETALVTTAEVIMIPIFAVMCELLGRIPTARFLSAVSLISSFMMGKLLFHNRLSSFPFALLYIYSITPNTVPLHYYSIIHNAKHCSFALLFHNAKHCPFALLFHNAKHCSFVLIFHNP